MDCMVRQGHMDKKVNFYRRIKLENFPSFCLELFSSDMEREGQRAVFPVLHVVEHDNLLGRAKQYCSNSV